MTYYQALKREYNKKQTAWKIHIRFKQTKWQRFWGWVWYLIAFPWVWLLYNIRDWRTAIIFAIVLLVYSGSVWGFYLAALFCGWNTTEAGRVLIGIGSSVWAWWLSPVGSPFILLCTFTTMGVKVLFDKLTHNHNTHNYNKGNNNDDKVS